MSFLNNLSMKLRLYSLAGALLVLLAVEGVLALGARGSHAVAFAALAAGLVCAVPLLLTARRMSAGTKMVAARIDSITTAAKGNLVRGLQGLADGDLTIELHAKTAASTSFDRDEFGELMAHCNEFRQAMLDCYDAYNPSVAKLRELVGTMSATADSVSAASEEMSATSDQAGKATGEIAQAVSEMAEGAERQARVAEEARRSAEEIAQAVAASAENAEATAEVARHAHEAATHGVDAAKQANQTMESVTRSSAAVTEAIRQLADKSEHIGMIVQTITGIAEQTNLLALNAAIEAARAGDQGRGFAVVAEEVRKLAEDSQNAAHEIAGLIGAMQEETTRVVGVVEEGAKRTQEGAAVVEQTREAFLSIGQAVEDMNARIEQIAAASEQITASAASMQQNVGEVAAVAEESSASTQEISASTEQTSASTQQIAASAHELAGNAETLAGLVAQFRVSS